MLKYDSYKDSGIEWIGEIPSHWDVKRNKYFTIPQKEKSNSGEEELLSVSEYKGVIPRKSIREGEEHLTRSETLEGYSKVKKGDLVSNIMLMWKRGLGVSDFYGIVSPSYSVFSFIKSEPKYFHYLFRTDQYVTEFRKNSTGVIESRLRLYDDSFGSLHSHFPPFNEQHQIVEYLDTKTTQIDTLIQKTQEKINLLSEKRTSLINHTVTKGLNPEVEMKESGVEWIGEIPKHWELRIGSTIGNFSKGSGIKKDEVTELGFPCIRYGEIYTTYELKFWETKSFINDDTTLNSVKVDPGVLLITGSGETPEDIGKCVVYLGNQPLFVGGDIIILKPKENFNSLFLSYLINSECIRIQREISSKGEIIVHIYSKNFREMRFPIPPLSEQIQIINYLDKQTLLIDTIISKEEKRIELLKEYRQSLISDVVTGKIKVTTNE